MEAFITPEVLRWAIERSKLALEDVAGRVGVKSDRLDAWASGEAKPTFKQAQNLANILRIPFGYLFLNKPPAEQFALPDLRTVGSAELRRPSIDFNDLVNDIIRKYEWYRDYRQQEAAEPLRLLPVDVAAHHAPKPRLGNDLSGPTTRAAIDVRDQLAHGRAATRQQELMKLRCVVPPRRGSASAGLPALHLSRNLRPVRGFCVLRKRRAEADLDTGADREVGGHYSGHGRRAVVLWPKLHPAVKRRNRQKAVRCEHGTGDHPQAVAERTARRQAAAAWSRSLAARC